MLLVRSAASWLAISAVVSTLGCVAPMNAPGTVAWIDAARLIRAGDVVRVFESHEGDLMTLRNGREIRTVAPPGESLTDAVRRQAPNRDEIEMLIE